MISLQKRFLFVHIPKTAGNSIQSSLRDYSEDQLVPLRKEQDGIERFGVRNPWDRMVSYYFTPTQSPETWDQKKFRKMIFKAVSVADYLRLDNCEQDPFANVDYIMRFENLAEDFRTVC